MLQSRSEGCVVGGLDQSQESDLIVTGPDPREVEVELCAETLDQPNIHLGEALRLDMFHENLPKFSISLLSLEAGGGSIPTSLKVTSVRNSSNFSMARKKRSTMYCLKILVF